MPNQPAQRRPADLDVTVGEVNRNVVDLRQVVQDFITEVRSNYVRQDVYDANSRAAGVFVELLQKRIEELEDARVDAAKESAQNRRLAVTAIVAPLIVGVVLAIFQAYLQ